jgi:hypothetical protein
MMRRKTTAEFICDAKALHGETYDYSKVVYKNSTTKVQIICQKHGAFYPTPADHLGTVSRYGTGCPKCSHESTANKQRKSIDDFLCDAKSVHGEKYDYSNVAYKNYVTEVLIICSDHGEFLQTPSCHISGKQGCPDCGKHMSIQSRTKNQSDFVKEAKAVHGKRYDYSKVVYTTARKHVIIICRKHGEFLQVPQHHLKNHGCPKCKGERLAEHFRMSHDKFIRRAKRVHGQKYDYSRVDYVRCDTDVIIICPNHGEFLQAPYNHVNRKQDCPECSKATHGDWCRKDQDDFIRDARKKHGDKYDYSAVEYVSTHAHVLIGCPIHGQFHQAPANHLSGRGCIQCGVIRRSNLIRKSQDDFIRDARKKHGDKYDYSAVVYINSHAHVLIGCPHHGMFSQQPANHLHGGSGCPQCWELRKEGWDDCDGEGFKLIQKWECKQ